MSEITRKPNFSALSIRDLLEARDAYHVHLMNLDHVVGTGIGKYLIRNRDPDSKDSTKTRDEPSREPRTLYNSSIKDWSLPCVLVFIDHWVTIEEFNKAPYNFVPPCLYMPDGRVVPTCVVYAEEAPSSTPPIYDLRYPGGLLGGGYPVLSSVQGQNRVGSIGCLVTDGHSVYALTNHHVAGTKKQKSFAIVKGEKKLIGRAARGGAKKIPFSQAYPGWPGERMIVNLDAGLIRVENIEEWTSQVYGIGEMGALLDASADTMHLGYIDKKVCAHGGASGYLEGRIKVLFYRYKAVGGLEYIADYLIGPDNQKEEEEKKEEKKILATRQGDSGTLWFLHERDDANRARPLAMQWGGYSLIERGGQSNMRFALATSLSTICRELDVQIMRDWDLGYSETWGKMAHYKIGADACSLPSDAKLRLLMEKNFENIALSDENLQAKNLPMKQDAFIPLADVPDLVWRGPRGKEGAAHFADIDQKGKGAYAGRTLLDLWQNDTTTLKVATWVDFYKSLGLTAPRERGALPFKVRQCYDEMVDAVKDRDLPRFVAAAGIASHYVGDCCIPLHLSHLHHGNPDNPEEKDVHTVYETRMIDRFRVEMIAGTNEQLEGSSVTSDYSDGTAAEQAAMELMAVTLETLSPKKIISAFNHHDGGSKRTKYMWETLKKPTIDNMVQGAIYLAELWQAAWREGGGNSIGNSHLKKISKSKLKALYNKKSFLEAQWLHEMSY